MSLSLQSRVRFIADALEQAVGQDQGSAEQKPDDSVILPQLVITPARIFADENDSANQQAIDCFNRAFAVHDFTVCPSWEYQKGMPSYAYLERVQQNAEVQQEEKGRAGLTIEISGDYPDSVLEKIVVEEDPEMSGKMRVRFPKEIRTEDIRVTSEAYGEKEKVVLSYTDYGLIREKLENVVTTALSFARAAERRHGPEVGG